MIKTQNISESQQDELRKSVAELPILPIIAHKLKPQRASYLFICIGSITWVLGFIYCNENKFNFIQATLTRGVSIIIVFGVLSKYLGYSLQFKTAHNFYTLAIRNSCVVIHGLVFTFVQLILPLPIVHTINSSGPIFAFFFDYLFFGIKINGKQILGIIIGVFGLSMTVNGALIMSKIYPSFEIEKSNFSYMFTSPLARILAAILQIGGTIAWSYGVIHTKILKGINPVLINLHLGIFLVFTCGILYPIFSDGLDLRKYLISIPASGVILGVGQLFYITGLSMSKSTGKVTIVSFVGVIAGYLLSIFRYGETINPICCLGAILIAFGLKKVLFDGDK